MSEEEKLSMNPTQVWILEPVEKEYIDPLTGASSTRIIGENKLVHGVRVDLWKSRNFRHLSEIFSVDDGLDVNAYISAQDTEKLLIKIDGFLQQLALAKNILNDLIYEVEIFQTRSILGPDFKWEDEDDKQKE